MQWSFLRREKRSAKSFCIGSLQGSRVICLEISFAWNQDSG